MAEYDGLQNQEDECSSSESTEKRKISATSSNSEQSPNSLSMDDEEEQKSSSAQNSLKDPRIIARKYQLELCKKALEENIIVYLGTGCGKTHIAVLLIYELGHLIRKPQKNICVFLAPTIPLVRQQATYIENSTDFKVGSYSGHSKHLKNHQEWEKETEQYEVLVMTPQILLRNLHHCFIRMELISLLIFDECHHAQVQSSHPYAQIMKEFYKTNVTKRPRIFGMTASPIVGKGGSSQENLPKAINSLENLLDAKVYSVEDKDELDTFVASPKLKVYYYGPITDNASSSKIIYRKKLEEIKGQCISMPMPRKKTDDLNSLRNKKKQLWRFHDNLIFCLENLGLWGATQAVRILLSGDQSERTEMIETEGNSSDNSLADRYLTQAGTVFNFDFMKDFLDGRQSDSSHQETYKEPFFSKKLLVLIEILSTCRLEPDMKCIVFVNRIIVARSLSYILGNLKCLEFWKSHFLVGFHSGLKNMSRRIMNGIVEKFRSGEINLLVATKVGEEGLDIQTCCLVIRFDLPETVASFIQSRGRARMPQSEYAFLVDRGSQHELNLIRNFIHDEDRMNKEIICRTSTETFDDSEETIYKVGITGASISAGYSVQLLHHYCSKLPHDEYFKPKPEFFYIDDVDGTVCYIILPSNAPIHQVVSLPQASKEAAKKNACLKACTELHVLGALTDHLLPGQDDEVEEGLVESDSCEDENLRGELHEMLIPAALKVPWTKSENPILLNFYFIQFIPVPKDRLYPEFGLFVKTPLPSEAATMELDLHLARGRIVKTKLLPSGVIGFDNDEVTQAQNFQEMFLKIILDRLDFFSDFVPLGKKDSSKPSSSTFYLLLPVNQNEHEDRRTVDWKIIRSCLSSPIFRTRTDAIDNGSLPASNTLELNNGPASISDIVNSLVFTPHNKLFFFVVDILPGTDANSPLNSRVSYAEYYIQKFGFELLHPKQPLLKAKQLFSLHNLLHNRLQGNTETRELEEHFVELPPELCLLKIVGFSKDIGSSLSLLPSIMHRLENLLVAIELKEVFSASFPEGSEVTAHRVLEALTTEKCSERFSLERLEVLGDAFLKYAVGRHLFLLYEALDEGQLTRKRSSIVNNSHLYKLATRSNLQVYIRDELFDPCQFFALGRPCTVICNNDTETTIHSQQESGNIADGEDTSNVKCSKGHHWLHKKTIADVVEALVGAFIVDSGFKAATAFLKWIGIQVHVEASQVSKVCAASKSYMSFSANIDTVALENLLGYRFHHQGLLLQAFVHPSYNKHSGGCYQRLEFLGDAVLDYLITSYLYSVYPKLKPGQLTDLRSVTVNNDSFAGVAVRRSFHKYLISDSDSLSEAVKKFVNFVQTSGPEKGLLEGPTCPKVLGDLVESCVGAILLDSGFNLNRVWRIMLSFLDPIMNFSSLQLNPVRELQELCQSHKWVLQFSSSKKGGTFLVEAQVSGQDVLSTGVVNEARVSGTDDVLSNGWANKSRVSGKDDVLSTGCAKNPNKKAAERVAAQEIFSKLKAKGYRPKKSLEEVLKSCPKKEAKLIGFDETPTEVIVDVSIPLENLEMKDDSPAASDHTLNIKTINEQPTNICIPNIKAFSRKPPSPLEAPGKHHGESSEDTNSGTDPQRGVVPDKGSAKSRLYNICAANYWNVPLFECCKEEGPSHSKMFTFKVTVDIEEASTTVLECFGEPRAKKKAAAEHAAEGALWYLKHLGYLPKEK